jgi:hypothetical protein
MAIAFVAGRDKSLHVSIGREYSGRYSFGLSVIAAEGIVIHAHPLAGECWPGSTWRSGCAGPMVSSLPIRSKTQAITQTFPPVNLQ